MLLVVIDSHTKWIEVVPLKGTNACATIEALRSTVFSPFDLPETIVSGNGSHFTAEEFSTLVRLNNIVRLRTAPYHPDSNGPAECAEQGKVTAGLPSRMFVQLPSDIYGHLSYRKTPKMRTLGDELRSGFLNEVVPLQLAPGAKRHSCQRFPLATRTSIGVKY